MAEAFPIWVIISDYLMGVVMWTLIGRFAMNLFLPEDSSFFFMKFFGVYFFEMTFAYQHFKCKEALSNHFPHFLKRTIYTVFKKAGCEI